MKTILKLILGLFLITLSAKSFAKGFDYNTLEDKILYIPEYDVNDQYAKKLMRKGKFEELEDAEAKAEYYNEIWSEAMAQSSYDATPYEIRGFDRKKLVKEKNAKALLLYFSYDDYGNLFVSLYSTGPKKAQGVATALINGLDLSTASDIRLMMNMLNYALNDAIELANKDGKVKNADRRSKYKESVVAFGDDLSNKTFLITPAKHKKQEKADQMDAEIKAAIGGWRISKVQFVSDDELEQLRLEGDENSFFWKNFNYYTSNPLLTYRINYLFTTNGDEVLFMFIGSKKLKASKLDNIQKKLLAKIEKYKKQLSK